MLLTAPFLFGVKMFNFKSVHYVNRKLRRIDGRHDKIGREFPRGNPFDRRRRIRGLRYQRGDEGSSENIKGKGKIQDFINREIGLSLSLIHI